MTEPNNSESLVRRDRATSPRTRNGGSEAKFNATKHGIFSNAIFVKGEAHAQYEELLRGLYEACQPEGTLEETLVDKLATILWRHRRLILAEGAEIQKSAESVKHDLNKRVQEEAKQIEESLKPEPGECLLKYTWHPGVLERCLELLTGLRDQIKEDGFPSERDLDLMRKLFGRELDHDEHRTVVDDYKEWFDSIEVPRDLRHRESSPKPDVRQKKVLRKIDATIQELKEIPKTQAPEKRTRNRLEVFRFSINEGVGLERLVRYEASLERAFDRALAQLERVQRIRRGQPVAPRLEVGVHS